jgi:RNA polymerase-interacting CarD/CdnL/TRCF family regulator
MAMDYLAIQGSATPVERVWSSAADTDTKKRNRLSSDLLAALQLLKMVYRQQRARKLSVGERQKWVEERLMLINEEDWVDKISNAQPLQFPELELELGY